MDCGSWARKRYRTVKVDPQRKEKPAHMCGIFGYYHFRVPRSTRYIFDVLLAGLRRLEYRGYDSAGLSVSQVAKESSVSSLSSDHSESGCLPHASPRIIKAVGNVDSLAVEVDQRVSTDCVNPDEVFTHQLGLAHTRWATHGAPSQNNSHPHADEAKTFAVVHNGIITNYKALKQLLVCPPVRCKGCFIYTSRLL